MNSLTFNIGIIDDDVQYADVFCRHFKTTSYNCSFISTSLSEVLDNPHIIPQNLDILFLDILMPGMLGHEGLSKLKILLPDTTIIMLSIVEDEEILLKCLCSGAGGYLLKDTTFAEIENYISFTQNGGSALSAKMARYIINYFGPKPRPIDAVLTEKNLQVLHLLAEGWAYKTIADRMNISIDGVRYHIKEIYRALGVQSMAQAIRKYIDGDLPTR